MTITLQFRQAGPGGVERVPEMDKYNSIIMLEVDTEVWYGRLMKR